jgi:hypothetical protein
MANLLHDFGITTDHEVKHILAELRAFEPESCQSLPSSTTVDDLHQYISTNIQSFEMRHLSFFFDDYKPQYWYWEGIECGRKVSGFATLTLCSDRILPN